MKDAKKVLHSSKDIKICNLAAKIDTCRNKRTPQSEEGIFDHLKKNVFKFFQFKSYVCF